MKKFLWKILVSIWCKDIWMMRYWLKHLNLKLFLDWMLFWKYQYVWNFEWIQLEFAEKFRKYIVDKNFKRNLVKWLDKESVITVNQIEKNINFILNSGSQYVNRIEYWIKYYDYEIKKYISKYTEDICLPIDHKEETVFFFKHWINEIENMKHRIQWKDILDCWAFIWDSAMMFSKEIWFESDWRGGVKHIYCLEPEPNNIKLLKRTIEMNNMNWKIIPVPLWVWKQKESFYINFNWSASSLWDKNENSSIINVDKIDNIVKNYWIVPGLIKRDIEWLEYDSILWAKETIKEYKPILLISIYHNWKDFYEIKPLIESWNLWYDFKIRHLSTNLFFETILICY